ncbi:MAG: hypothetical protein QF363_15860 [Planctomycetaceae bacterium]|nr:hypothetical protein [Planctomycetaceae bacterium]
MTDWRNRLRSRLEGLVEWFQSPRGLWAFGVVVVLLAILWLSPRSDERLVTVDGQDIGPAPAGSPTRQVAWAPVEAIEVELAGGKEPVDLIAPRLAGRGQILYLTRRDQQGRLDIFQSHWERGRWLPASPLDSLNSEANDIGPVLTDLGRTLYFFSNREGGQGGYDLYVSRRSQGTWTPPENLGPTVNSPADEFDPAVSPDGRHLFFASDRATARVDQTPRWTTTLRLVSTEADFDLYQATRESADSDWGKVRPLDRLNLPGSHEGAPFVSPDGAFLYFASNRPARAGEPRNLDLYRARWNRGEFDSPRNLGSMINTASDETEPAVAAEGFRLVFATNRDGHDRLYQSVAREIELRQRWDNSRLEGLLGGFRGLWGRALLITLIVAAIVGAILWSRGWLWRKAMASRFVFGSIAFHLLVLTVLFLWKLDVVLAVIAEAVVDAEISTELLDDNQHQSHEDGQESYEKVDELKSLDDSPSPEVVRRVTEAMSVPLRTESVVPQVPLRQAASLPPEMVLRVAPEVTPSKSEPRKLVPLTRRERADPDRELALPELAEAALPPAEPEVRENRVDASDARVQRETVRPVTVVPRRPRAATPAPATVAVADVPDEQAARPVSDDASPRDVRIDRTTRVAAATAVPATVEATQEAPQAVESPREQRLAVSDGDLPRKSIATVAPGITGELVERPAPRMAVAAPRTDRALRAVVATPTPAATPARRQVQSSRPRVLASRTAAGIDSEVVLDKSTRVESARTSDVKVADASVARRVPRRRRTVAAAPGLERAVADSTALPVADTSPATASLATPDREVAPRTTRKIARRKRPVAVGAVATPVTEVDEPALTGERVTAVGALASQDSTLQRSSAVSVANIRTPRELSGPIRRVPDRVIIGEQGPVENKVAPDFGPLVTRLDRRKARAPRVALAEDNAGLRALFTLRQGDTRRKYIKLFGGSDSSEEAVNRGLVWLAAHQDKNGHWSLNQFQTQCKGKHPNCSGAGRVHSNTAATGMALLPFLAAGHTHRSGRFQQVVEKGVNWLASQQKANGDLLSTGDSAHAQMYSHGIAAIALCEAYGMTEDPKLKPAAEKSLDFIVKAQNQSTGGWRYRPGEAGDTSVVGWQMMALKSGEMAGLTIPPRSIALLDKWLKRVEGNKPVGGQFGYTNSSVRPSMTAEGLLCLQFMGVDRNDPRMRAGADYLLKNLPRSNQKNSSYYWYYATQVMYHMQGKYWEAWNEPLRKQLVSTQKTSGQMAGTWDPADNWENQGGRIYATAMKLLVLEVYYRHLPLYDQLDDE